jgi:arsenate reductase (glutaredoxin)
VRELILLTETAAPFFARLGYQPAARESMPPEVQATGEFASLCPSTAVCLAKPLRLAIYHNPNCGTSRNVLALMREASFEPDVIEYLRTPPDRATLLDLLKRMNFTPRQLLREKGTPYAELGLGDTSLPDDVLVSHMLETPLLINRPIVVAPWGVRLCRPSETAREFLLLE